MLDFINFEIFWFYKKLFLPELFYTQLQKALSIKKRFIIIPLSIILENGAHSNYLIIDKKKNEIERFEPNGSGNPHGFNYNNKMLDRMLELKFEDSLN